MLYSQRMLVNFYVLKYVVRSSTVQIEEKTVRHSCCYMS